MIRKRQIAKFGAVAFLCVIQTVNAQFFTNDLTDATAAASDFDEYISSHGNATWTYVSDDSATGQDGNLNTIFTNGVMQDYVTIDDDTARSYLGTTYANWADHSWTAHIGVETVNVDPKNYIFFGLGDPTPNEGYYNEPSNGESVFVSWQSGNSNSKISVKRNGATVVNTGAWQGDPGYDIWMTYNHIAKTVVFEIDNWNGGRFSGINVTTDPVSIDGFLTDPNNMHIFFGANAKVTWADFDVHEISSDTAPFTPENVYTVISNMAVDVKWDAAALAEGYEVKRSSDSGSGYVTIGSTTNLTYLDTTVETNETYYYVVSATNAFGASDDSAEATGVGLPYDIIGANTSYPDESLDKDNLFDNDISTFFDTGSPNGGWVGLDYGANNAQQIMVIEYVVRGGWQYALARIIGSTFEGANSADFSDAVLLHTVPETVSDNPTPNSITVSVETPFRYVRLKARSDVPLYAMAEVKFYTAEDLTVNNTPTVWLDSYYDIPSSNFADYAEADLSDTDEDGLPAYAEYDLGGDPTDANSPAGVNNLYAWPEAALENVVHWDASAIADETIGSGYIVYRSLDDSTYTAVATVTSNQYNDTAVTAGETYYYKASVTNATYEYESTLSDSEMATANQYDIIGLMNNSGASKTRWFYELFDKNLDTFMDDNAKDGYAGLDFGSARTSDFVAYRLRNDSGFASGGYEIVVDGVPVSVNRPQYCVYGNTFEGSNDGTTWTVFATITNTVPQMVEWNLVDVSGGVSYRYVRYYPANGVNNYAMGDIEFLTEDDFTENGTLILWLEANGLTEADDELDTDVDGHEAWQEYVAGTDPVDSSSVLKVTEFSLTNGLAITWQSVEGKTYSIVTNTSLTVGSPGTVASGIAGQGGETSYTGTVSGASSVFYEIGVE